MVDEAPRPERKVLFLKWRDELFGAPDYGVKVARHLVKPNGGAFPLHTHDYHEVFWIESGRGVHEVNGQRFPLISGDILFMRAHDRHFGFAAPSHKMILVNISFKTDVANAFAARFRDEWPWTNGPLPRHAHISSAQLHRLQAWAADLSLPHRRRIDLEAFLLDLTRIISEPSERDICGGFPDWLRDAIAEFNHPKRLSAGTRSLSEIAGRSQEYINRVVRSAQGRTTTDVINAVRLRWAASELRTGQRPIPEIAEDCGLSNLSHFYKLFKAEYKVTPKVFRHDAVMHWQAGKGV